MHCGKQITFEQKKSAKRITHKQMAGKIIGQQRPAGDYKED